VSEPESVRWIASHGPCSRPVPRNAIGRCARHAVNASWLLVDVVLASRWLSSLIIAMVTLSAAAVCERADGLNGLVGNFPALAMICGAAAGLIRLGRERRGLKPLAHTRPVVRWQRAMPAEGR